MHGQLPSLTSPRRRDGFSGHPGIHCGTGRPPARNGECAASEGLNELHTEDDMPVRRRSRHRPDGERGPPSLTPGPIDQQRQRGHCEQERCGRQRHQARMIRLMMTVVIVTMTGKMIAWPRHGRLPRSAFRRRSRHRGTACRSGTAVPLSAGPARRCVRKSSRGEIKAPRPLPRMTSRHPRHHAGADSPMTTASLTDNL